MGLEGLRWVMKTLVGMGGSDECGRVEMGVEGALELI